MNRSCRVFLIAAVVLLGVLACPAQATDRYFRDSTATSPNGRYRIDAKSPDNANGRPFASNFTYTLTDTATNKVVWTRKQPMERSKGHERGSSREGPPTAVFVRDDGLVAARLAHDTVLFLRSRDGHKIAESPVLYAFPAEEQRNFVSMSTAGPIWSQDSQWFFIDVPGPSAPGRPEVYFVVRPYWNKRLVIHARTGRHVDLHEFRGVTNDDELRHAPDEVARVLRAAIAEEAAIARRALSAAPASIAGPDDYMSRWTLANALQSTRFLRISDTEGDLRRLEQALDESNDPQGYLRRKVRRTLRTLGLVPAPGFGVQLYPYIKQSYYMTPDTSHPYNAVVPLEDRTANAPKVREGMSVKELTDFLGCPDEEVRWDPVFAFDYDIDAPEPYTLRVTLDQDHTIVERVERITPFAFLHDVSRIAGDD